MLRLSCVVDFGVSLFLRLETSCGMRAAVIRLAMGHGGYLSCPRRNFYGEKKTFFLWDERKIRPFRKAQEEIGKDQPGRGNGALA